MHRTERSTADAEFADFVRSASPGLLQAAWLLTGEREAARDLVQTALLKTYAAWRRVRADDAYAYTRRVLVNAHVDRWRRRPWREAPSEQLPDLSPAPDATGTIDSRLALAQALGVLTRRERAVVVLRYYADLSEAQVADDLGISRGTVKSTASKALAKLRVSPGLRDDERAIPHPSRRT
ncbi:SigE family RNA polymerase sigma factor [Motilibacter deserti]|uniref:SigE family RNA polymerase sigma factor n=1 Tax=Motilibacter deserti TaxID=2714956 RepID=A0ABX0GQV5_9ACTN|nr:SigE family RNA polymerase sigma factor [Motilibacter deserti]